MYLRPRTLDEACAALAAAPAALLAGGTDVYPALGERPPPERILDLTGIADLGGVTIEADRVRIGAGTTWARIAGATDLPPSFDGLRQAAREIGSVQIQNVATVGGNLCNASPAADSVPPLLTLDAAVRLASRRGSRTLPLTDFIRGSRRTDRAPDEILAEVIVPRRALGGRSAFVKLGARRHLVISVAMVAARIVTDPEGCVAESRIAVGSCSAVAQRLTRLEDRLVGAAVAEGLGRLVGPADLAPLTPIDDLRGTAEYRRHAAAELVARALDLCSRGSPPP